MKTFIVAVMMLLLAGCVGQETKTECSCPAEDTYLMCPGRGVLKMDPGEFNTEGFKEQHKNAKELFDHIMRQHELHLQEQRRQGT